MLDLTSLIGTCLNIAHEFTDSTTGITGYVIEYDIEYITRAVILTLSFWFVYKCILGIIYSIGGRQK